jgi:hypothetical protein
MDNATLARVARSMAARYGDWRSHACGARGCRLGQSHPVRRRRHHGGLHVQHGFPLGSSNTYLGYAIATSGTRSFADINLIGEADVSGKYQQWIAAPLNQREKFKITTPDRRITGAASDSANGVYFVYRATDPFDRAYGPYHGTYYQWRRITATNTGNWPTISRVELNLYKAEALARTNDGAGAAALANLRRMSIGQLPALTATGPANSPTCVPRTVAGACGTLLDAIRYERQIELAGNFGDYMWMDRRGWGTLPRGTPLHLPIPGEQLEILGIDRYSFGGGLAGSAQ